MKIISAPESFNQDRLFIDLRPVVGHQLYLKVEGMNFAGSVKLKAALEMVLGAEADGTLKSDSVLIESSSGNLGVALAMIAASRGYEFVCVTDNRCNLATRQLIEALGARVHVVTEPTPDRGLLGARQDYVRDQLADPRFVQLNQYANPNAWRAHYKTTGPSIIEEFAGVDVVFVGAGTCGTLMGVARYFVENHPHVKVVAVDAVGSVTFGTPAARRMIPGLGTGVRPAHVDEAYLSDIMHIEEPDTVRACHKLAAGGYLFGGSTGTVVSGACSWLEKHDPGGELTAVCLAPDMGERYLDTIYHHNWVESAYGPGLFDQATPAAPEVTEAAAV